MAQPKKKKSTQQIARRNLKKARRAEAHQAAARAAAIDKRETYPFWQLCLLNILAFFVIWVVVFWGLESKHPDFWKTVIIIAAFTFVIWAYVVKVIPQIIRGVSFYKNEDEDEHRKKVLQRFWTNALAFLCMGLCMELINTAAIKTTDPLWANLILYSMGGGLYGLVFWVLNQNIVVKRNVIKRNGETAIGKW